MLVVSTKVMNFSRFTLLLCNYFVVLSVNKKNSATVFEVRVFHHLHGTAGEQKEQQISSDSIQETMNKVIILKLSFYHLTPRNSVCMYRSDGKERLFWTKTNPQAKDKGYQQQPYVKKVYW